MLMSRLALFAAVLLAFASPRLAHSQVLYGTLTGNVADPASAAVPGAHVEAVNQETNVKSAGDTDEHGLYRFTNVQPGLYRVTITAKSFRTYVETNVQIVPNQIRRVDVQL